MSLIQSIAKSMFSPGAGDVTVSEAQQKINSARPPFVIDVRTPAEFHTGHISGAALLPLDELTARMHELPKEREILCVCQSGGRSSSATRQLAAAGYTVLNISGGMSAWMQAGLPVVRGR
jgi:rhodanese-related sulfurtransferase